MGESGRALLVTGFGNPLVGSKTRDDLMRQNEGHSSSPVNNFESGDHLGWYVRVNGKKVFGPFPRQRCDAFVNARRNRTGTKTEVRRGLKGVWHTVTHSLNAPAPISKRGSAYKIWEPKTSSAHPQTTTTESVDDEEAATRMSEIMRRRLSRVNRVRRERVENERIAREAEKHRIKVTRRAGAGFLSRLYDVPEQNILPRRMSNNLF